jgi:hypothetical protein
VAGERRRFGKYLIADLRDLLERPGAVTGLLLTLVGALLLVVGLVGAILVGPSSSYTDRKTVQPGAPAVVVTSGVVGAVGPEVTVTARRLDGGVLFVGRAISRDVTDLTARAPSLQVRGVHALHGLVVQARPGSTSLANVQTSDIWRDSSAGAGSRSLVWRPDEQSQSVLIASTDGAALPALQVTVTWHRSGWFPAALLLILIGLGLLVAGLHSLTGGHLMRRVANHLVSRVSRIPVPARAIGGRRARAAVTAGLAVVLLSGCSAAGGLVGVHSPGASSDSGPALEPQQARAIVGRVLTTANQADRTRNATTAAAAYDGLALQMIAAAYEVDTAQGVKVPARPTSDIRPAVLLTRGTAYPRFFFAVLAGNQTQPPVVSLLTAKDASSAYRIAGSVLLLPKAHLPEVADPSEGSPVLAPDTSGLALPPEAVGSNYAAVLNTGSTAPEATHFTSDPFLTQVQQAAAAQRAEVARFGTYAQTHEAVPGAMVAIRTSNGGALVFAALRRTSTFTARPGNVATLPADVRVVTGEVQASTFTSTAAELLLFSVPPAGKGRITLVAASDGLISASAH